MQNKGLLGQLIQSFCCLPGVGPKSAQRMAFHLLQRDRDGARQLAAALQQATEEIGYCRLCRTFTEQEICPICAHNERNQSLLCVVEAPADAWVIEQSNVYQGVFFILHGRLSPLDGIGPDELGIDLLQQRLAAGEIKEVVLATNSTVEGEVTAQLIGEIARKHNVHATRIAHGVPMGGELEYIDSGTLSYAFNGRTEIEAQEF